MQASARTRVGTVGAAIVDALTEAGVDAAFGMDDPQGLWSALRGSPIATMILHDERSAGFAATGYTLASQRLSLCTGITGPGGMNLATPMLEAQQASIPVLFMIGEANPARADLHGFQTAPHERVLSPLSKACVRIGRGEDVAAAVHRAVSLATGGRPGPVLLLTGDDLLWEPAPEAPGADPAPTSRALLAPGGPAATQATITAVHDALNEARRPVIVAGGGVLSSQATEQLRTVAEKYRIPVAMTVLGKGAIPDRHELCLGVASSYTGGLHGIGALANQRLEEADTVLVVGSDLDPLTSSGGAWPAREARMIRIDIDPAELSTHRGMPVNGDARTVLAQLAEETRGVHRDPDYQRWLEEATGAARAHRDRIRRLDRSERPPGFVWPGAVMAVLSEALRDGDAIVTDASFSSSWAIDRLEQDKAGRVLFGPRGSGVLGWGLPAALGVKLERPDAQVTCLTGDGGLHFSVGELETALRMGLPLAVVVLNNRSLGFQRQSDRLHEGRDYADLCFDERVDYAQVARAFGWDAVQAETPEELADAHLRARDGEAPTLIEVPTDPEVWAPITKFDGLLERGVGGSQMAAVLELERRDAT